ncbi:MAG TPA: hypothetical protein CFH81_00400 [Sulfurovum sp. UBA12169]|nr:MAG TPA: hypothetical protein CFH81_00400 [Sulfurovum sp. UBA12169]
MRRHDIVTILISHLQQISSANGFYTEAGANVFEWRAKAIEDDLLPAIIVCDPEDNAVDDSQTLKHKLKIEIDIAVSSGKQTTMDMRMVSSDILKAFGLFEEEVSQVCRYLGSETLIEHKEKLYAGVRLEFEIEYQSKRWEQ